MGLNGQQLNAPEVRLYGVDWDKVETLEDVKNLMRHGGLGFIKVIGKLEENKIYQNLKDYLHEKPLKEANVRKAEV